MVTISQCMQMTNYYVVQLKLMPYVNYTLIIIKKTFYKRVIKKFGNKSKILPNWRARFSPREPENWDPGRAEGTGTSDSQILPAQFGDYWCGILFKPQRKAHLQAFVNEPGSCTYHIKPAFLFAFPRHFSPPTICFLNFHDSLKWALLHSF